MPESPSSPGPSSPGPPGPPEPLERKLAHLSADEMVAALGLGGAPRLVRGPVRSAFSAASAPLGRLLARFDGRVDAVGLSRAASGVLADLGATVTRDGPAPPRQGALLVVANHPGAYDAFGLLAAIGRDDIAVVAADRLFLRALPALARHMCFVPEGTAASAMARARGLRSALRHLAQGGALLHFGAGRIEPDPAFPPSDGSPLLGPWVNGTGVLVRGALAAKALVVGAIVAGVHSAAAKRLWITRLAERRGLTTLAPLLQVALPRYRRVFVTVRFTPAREASTLVCGHDNAATTARVREWAGALLDRSSGA